MMNASFPDRPGEHRTEPVPPEPDRLVADIDATFEQQVFDLPQRQRIADVHHHREANHLGRTVEITEWIFHPQRLRAKPAGLNPICSDTAGLAIALGVFTYSKKVMLTVGAGLMPLSPVAAWIVVMSHSIVLFLFASQGLESLLAGWGLPTIPLVPVSSTQAVVGAMLGLGIIKGGGGMNYRVLARIASGWVTTPIIACIVCFVSLFLLQNVFG